jgi:hypothetical protein
MSRRVANRSSAGPAMLLAGLFVAACGTGAARPSPSSPPTGTPTVPASVAVPTAVASPVATASTQARPPDASLAAEGGDAVVGQLGSYTWADGGSDSPWLPGAPIAVGAGEPLSVTLADGTPVGAWTAVRAPADQANGAGAVEAGEGSGVIAFSVGAPGRWTVAVTIAFVAGGSATWYWQLEVT